MTAPDYGGQLRQGLGHPTAAHGPRRISKVRSQEADTDTPGRQPPGPDAAAAGPCEKADRQTHATATDPTARPYDEAVKAISALLHERAAERAVRHVLAGDVCHDCAAVMLGLIGLATGEGPVPAAHLVAEFHVLARRAVIEACANLAEAS